MTWRTRVGLACVFIPIIVVLLSMVAMVARSAIEKGRVVEAALFFGVIVSVLVGLALLAGEEKSP